MGLVLDAVFAAIVLCFVVAGYRAGLMRTLVEFVGSDGLFLKEILADAGADDRLRGERRVPATVVAYGRQPVGLPVWGI